MKNTENLKNQTIGVEIEMTGITRERAAQTIAEYFCTEKVYIGGVYYTFEVRMPDGRKWSIMRDSSITPQRKEHGAIVSAGDAYRVEVTSPILQYSDIETVQEIIRKLRKAGALVNPSAGIHIHIGAEKFTPETLRNIVNIIASKEDILYRALQINRNRLEYCKKTNQRLIEAINKEKPKTMEEVKKIWYREDPYNTTAHYNHTRYHGCNLHATFTKGTIEFRLFNSTLHAGEVKAYIQFCLAVTNQALTQKRALARRTAAANEKYAFRCWMLRLGLIGEEFKTCRLHFLKNLEGNAAWKTQEQADRAAQAARAIAETQSQGEIESRAA